METLKLILLGTLYVAGILLLLALIIAIIQGMFDNFRKRKARKEIIECLSTDLADALNECLEEIKEEEKPKKPRKKTTKKAVKKEEE